MTLVRDAQAGDLTTIQTVYAEAVRSEFATWELEPPDLAEMNRRFGGIVSAGFPYLVAEEGGDILGYGYAGPFRTRGGYAWSVEDTVYVSEHARGRGAGRAILQALIDRSTKLGMRQMVAVLGDADGASRRLHEKLGFEARGRLPGFGYKLGAWRDLLLMQRALGQGSASPPGDRP